MAKEAILCQGKAFSPADLPRCEIISCLMQQFSTWADFAPQKTFADVWRCFWVVTSRGRAEFATGIW